MSFENILEILLNRYQANVFDPQHLKGASSDLVRSMFQVGQKAAELERVKLQMEIQKEKSEIRRKKLEKQLKMAGKAGGRSSLAKNPKKMKTKQEQDDADLLDDLVLETDPDKRQMSYLTLEPGGFMMKGADRKTRLDQRQARIAAAAGKPDDNEEDETEQERLECEANELSSQLKKAERAEAQARDKEERDKAKWYSQCITGGCFLKQPKAVTLVETKKRKRSQ